MAIVVPVVTVLLFVFLACLSLYTYLMQKHGTDFDFYRFPVVMRMKEQFNMQDSQTLRLRRMTVRSMSEMPRHWNKTQMTLKSCGLNSYADWARIEQDVVPDSCCKIYQTGCGRNFSPEDIFQIGCEGEITVHIKKQYIIQTQDEQIFYLLVSID